MRILIISTFFPPQNSIASLRPYSFAKFWKEQGHEIEVLTTKKENESNPLKMPLDFLELIEVPLPKIFNRAKMNYGEKISDEKSFSVSVKRSLLKGINFLRFKKGIFNACRMPDITDIWAFNALKEAKKRKNYDIVVSSCGPYTTHVVAWRLKRANKARFWAADYRDTWSDNYIYPGLFPFNLFEKALEKRILCDADMISTISDPFARAFSAKRAIQSLTIENGFDSDDLIGIPQEKRFQNDGKIRIIHTGSIYLGKRDPLPFFKAIRRLFVSDPDLIDKLEVHFFGQRNANLEEMIEAEGVGKWVRSSGFVKREEALWAQRDADMLLFLPWSDASIEGVLTGKLFEYLYSKTPILSASSLGPKDSAEMLIEKIHAGYIVKGEESIALFLKNALLKQAIPKMQIDQEHLKFFSRKELACKFLAMMQKKLKEKSDVQ